MGHQHEPSKFDAKRCRHCAAPIEEVVLVDEGHLTYEGALYLFGEGGEYSARNEPEVHLDSREAPGSD